jgi:hypothetical protein
MDTPFHDGSPLYADLETASVPDSELPEKPTVAETPKSAQVLDLFEQRRLTESELLDALADTEWKPASKISLLQQVCWRLRCPWLICELALETRSYLHRIGTLIWLRTFPINCLGPPFGVDDTGRLVPCTRTRGRRLGIHKFQNTDLWASPADMEVFLAGWNAAARWCELYPHICSPDKETGCLPCSPPAVARESQPRRKWRLLSLIKKSILEPTKRDQSIRPA